MDKDHPEGIGERVTDSIKEAIGKVTGDVAIRAERSAEKASGTAQDAVRKAEGALRHAGKR